MMIERDAGPAIPRSAPVAGFEDLQAGHSYVLRNQVVARSVSEIADLLPLLDSAEETCRSGLWGGGRVDL